MRLPARSALVIGALALVAACGGTGTNGGTGGFVSATGGITKVEPQGRQPAPVIEGQDLEGRPLSSRSFAGKTLVVNVWGSWCAPCRQEAPTLATVSKEYASKDVQFLGVNVRDNDPAARAFDQKFGIDYPSLSDYGQKSLLGFTKSLPAQGIPTTWIIDSTGKVAVRISVDGLTASTLAGLIDDVQASTAARGSSKKSSE